MVSAVNRAFGASAVTSSDAGWPTKRSGLIDGEERRRAASGGDVQRRRRRATSDDEEGKEPAEHGLHYTSLIKCEVRNGEVAVSSRGQDTWFSATGPGFDSPYRYQYS